MAPPCPPSARGANQCQAARVGRQAEACALAGWLAGCLAAWLPGGCFLSPAPLRASLCVMLTRPASPPSALPCSPRHPWSGSAAASPPPPRPPPSARWRSAAAPSWKAFTAGWATLPPPAQPTPGVVGVLSNVQRRWASAAADDAAAALVLVPLVLSPPFSSGRFPSQIPLPWRPPAPAPAAWKLRWRCWWRPPRLWRTPWPPCWTTATHWCSAARSSPTPAASTTPSSCTSRRCSPWNGRG